MILENGVGWRKGQGKEWGKGGMGRMGWGDKSQKHIHKRDHTNEGLECDISDFTTHIESTLKRHKGAHLTIKPHKCDHCGKSFVARYRTKEH